MRRQSDAYCAGYCSEPSEPSKFDQTYEGLRAMTHRIEVELSDEQFRELEAYIAWHVTKPLPHGQAVRQLMLRALTYSRTAEL